MGPECSSQKKMGEKKKEEKKMQLQRADKVFNSGVHSSGVFPFVISLIKVPRSFSWIWKCQSLAGKVLEVGLLLGQGTREEIMQSAVWNPDHPQNTNP